MGKKHKHPEHVNLERWLVSYADFITLLFATFVVLYALSQADISKFEQVEQSLKRAFSKGQMEGNTSLLDNVGESILSAGNDGMNLLAPILERMESQYEEKTFGDVKNSIERMKKQYETDGIQVKVSERGLVISVIDHFVFESGSAKIKPGAIPALIKIGQALEVKFPVNLIRVEGHTDSIPIKSAIYPSNWELSSSRASEVVRFFINRFKIKPNRFAAIGYASSRPVETNKTAEGRSKNRRVEIIVLRNKITKAEPKVAGLDKERLDRIKVLKKRQEKSKANYHKKTPKISDAVKKMIEDSGVSETDVLLIKDDRYAQDEFIKQQIKQVEMKKPKHKLPVAQKKIRHLTKEEAKIINILREEGTVNDAVADILKDRGAAANAIIIKEH